MRIAPDWFDLVSLGGRHVAFRRFKVTGMAGDRWVEMTIEGAQPWDPRIVAVDIRELDGSPAPAAAYAEVPALAREAAASAATLMEYVGPVPGGGHEFAGSPSRSKRTARAYARADVRPSGVRAGPRKNALEPSWEIARVCREARRCGEQVQRAVMDHFGVSVNAADARIAQARRDGFDTGR